MPAPGAGLLLQGGVEGRAGAGAGGRGGGRLLRFAFIGDALRPRDGRRGSNRIKEAAWKEGKSEGGTGTVGGGAPSWAVATGGGADSARPRFVFVILTPE